MKSVSSKGLDFSDLTRQLRANQNSSSEQVGFGAEKKSEGSSFSDMLRESIKEVNAASKESDRSMVDLASGKTSNIHETMLAATKAELGFNMLVQLRNKAIESYQEVMRMQV
jgi:flagellar hook-basal body complex protein FliE